MNRSLIPESGHGPRRWATGLAALLLASLTVGCSTSSAHLHGAPPLATAPAPAPAPALAPARAAHQDDEQPAVADDPWADVVLEVQDLGGGVSMITGRGGNLGLSVGADGAFLIDDQFGPLSGRILETIEGLSDQPLRFVVNTHWHGDHTGGNQNLARGGALIVAHENVHKRMQAGQFMEDFGQQVPPAPSAALPVITFTDAMTFHWNGDDVGVYHVAPAHTDGDALVYFAAADVLHMGDTFFNGMYPFIDTGSAGHLAGMLAAADRGLALCNENTKIIPGHGPLASSADLRAYRAMLMTLGDRIETLVKAGKSRDEIIAAKPSADHDDVWGGGFMQPDVWVGIVVDGITAR